MPGLDNPAALAQTDPAPIDHIGRYAESGTPVVVIDAETGERVPIWVEIDSNASGPDSTLLEIHPARNYESGHRYIVAMRKLRAADGSTIPAPEGFRYYRDELPSDEAAIDDRREHFEGIFETLRDAGIRRAPLYLAWDFTVASDENIAGRALHMRNDAFASLGDTEMADGVVTGDSPQFTVTGTSVPADPQIARRVTGTFTVPCYLEPNCDPGGKFDLDANGLPVRNGDYTANFICIVPRRAVGAPGPGAGPARDLRPRPVRRRRRGLRQLDQPGPGRAVRLHDVRDRRDRDVGRRHPEHGRQHPQRPLQLRPARRPAPAGPARTSSS